ncbi:MAG: thiol reductant ABC exporter subunit CydD [Actinomycetia bacterium]|nr:thiol reductant ABC exporter subunit CydD [Actinomycetes bacterium]
MREDAVSGTGGGASRGGPLGAAWAAARPLLALVPGGRGLLVAAVAASVAAGGLTVVTAVLLSRAVAAVFLGGAGPAAVLPLLAAGGAVALGRAGAEAASRALAAELAYRAKRAVRARILARLFAVGPAWQEIHDTGTTVQTVLDGVDALGTLVSTYVPQLAVAGAVPVLVLVAVGLEFWLAGVILLVTGPLIPVFMVLIGRAAEARTARQWETLTRLGRHFLDVLGGLPTLILAHQVDRQLDIIRRVSDDYRRAVMATLRLALLSALVLELFAAVATALVAVAVGLALVDGRVAFAPALAVLMLAPEFYLPQRTLGSAFHQAMEGVTAATAVLSLLDTPVVRPAGGRRVPTRPGPWTVEWSGVSLRFAGRPPLLEDFSVAVGAGEHVALVGPSGSGKTTLLHLLLGYLRPERGTVAVGGIPLETLDLDWWRRQVAYLPQWPYLVFGSVRDNLVVARPDADDRRLWAALEAADAAAFVARLPGGLDAPVGDRGLMLSGGQAQRLALARLFLRDAPVVLLDEPTDHLDPTSRERVWTALEHHCRDRTLVVVTHRAEEAARVGRRVGLGAAAAPPAVISG